MDTLQERFAAEAEALVGTPFVEHGRDPEVGLDCAGLLIVPARRIGLEVEDLRYVTLPGSDYWKPMARIVESLADPVAGEWERGDVLGFRIGSVRNHLGVYLGSNALVHACADVPIRRVVRVPMDPHHRRMVKAAWRLR